MVFDTIILGGGPAGMALAHGCARFGERVLLIEAEGELGGCHKVERSTKDGLRLFYEHGPRVYNTQYRTVERFWKDFGQSLDTLFRPYSYRLDVHDGKTWRDLSWWDQWIMVSAFLRHLVSPGGEDISVADFAKRNRLSAEALKYFDNVCRFSDGGGANTYSLYELMELVNQHALTTSLQPIRPNDMGMIAMWEDHIRKQGVTVWKHAPAQHVEVNDEGVITVHIGGKHKTNISGRKCVLAMPPSAFAKILHASPSQQIKDAFGPHAKLLQWSSKSSYMKYGSMTFHWRNEVNLPEVNGFPYTEWGIVFVELTKTMKVDGIKTMVSLAITQWDVPSSHLQKKPRECANIQECRNEVFRQWKRAMGVDVPSPDFMTGDDFVKEDEDEMEEDAFFKAVDVVYVPAKSPSIPNLYQVGCQNGEQKYHFTSMEAAVSNAAALLHMWFPEAKHTYPIISPWTVRDVIMIMLLSILMCVFVWVMYIHQS